MRVVSLNVLRRERIQGERRNRGRAMSEERSVEARSETGTRLNTRQRELRAMFLKLNRTHELGIHSSRGRRGSGFRGDRNGGRGVVWKRRKKSRQNSTSWRTPQPRGNMNSQASSNSTKHPVQAGSAAEGTLEGDGIGSLRWEEDDDPRGE